MDFKQHAAIEIKKWFCSKSDEELSEYLIQYLVNGDDTSIFRKSLPKKIANNWIISLDLLSGKRIILPLGINEHTKSIIVNLQINYKNCTHSELNRIRSEFSTYIDEIKY